jgi:mannose/fructose/N-acetylgalactosamine-specific phosphotransferase system component IIC
VSARSWGLAAVGVVALCLAIGFSLAFQLDFVLVGIMVVAALVATYIAGRMDKRKQRGPWAKENSDG